VLVLSRPVLVCWAGQCSWGMTARQALGSGLSSFWLCCCAAQVNAAAGGGGDAEEPWADEVTGVLLALVLLSHKRYLQAPLLPE